MDSYEIKDSDSYEAKRLKKLISNQYIKLNPIHFKLEMLNQEKRAIESKLSHYLNELDIELLKMKNSKPKLKHDLVL